MRGLERLMLEPHPFLTVSRVVFRLLRLGRFETRVRIGAVERPHYAHCVLNAAVLARKLGHHRMSVMELGVAGGNGLLALERLARETSIATDVAIDLYGFDTGVGLPEPVDYRDLPYHWKRGFYRTDVQRLRRRIAKAQLVLGDIRVTGKSFFSQYDPAPIGAIIFDLDLYSATCAGLELLEGGERYYLPRVFCYFDDIIGTEVELYNDHTGERLAINEFNSTHERVKIEPAYHLLSRKVLDPWCHQIRICHFFDHSQYNNFISTEDQQLCCK